MRSYISRGSIPNWGGAGGGVGGGEGEHDTEHTERLCNTQGADTQDIFWLTAVFHCSMSNIILKHGTEHIVRLSNTEYTKYILVQQCIWLCHYSIKHWKSRNLLAQTFLLPWDLLFPSPEPSIVRNWGSHFLTELVYDHSCLLRLLLFLIFLGLHFCKPPAINSFFKLRTKFIISSKFSFLACVLLYLPLCTIY